MKRLINSCLAVLSGFALVSLVQANEVQKRFITYQPTIFCAEGDIRDGAIKCIRRSPHLIATGCNVTALWKVAAIPEMSEQYNAASRENRVKVDHLVRDSPELFLGCIDDKAYVIEELTPAETVVVQDGEPELVVANQFTTSVELTAVSATSDGDACIRDIQYTGGGQRFIQRRKFTPDEPAPIFTDRNGKQVIAACNDHMFYFVQGPET